MATTADRVLEILTLYTGQHWTWTVEEASVELDIPTSTAYRYFKSLAQAGLLSTHTPGSYILGPGICALDRQMRLHDPLISAAKTEMQRLADADRESIVLLTKLFKNTVMCVHREGENLTADGYERGRPMPLERGAASKVILAFLSAKQIRNISASSPNAAALDDPAMREELRRLKAQGYAITRGEIDAGAIGISVPIFRADQSLEGSLSFVLNAASATDLGPKIEALIRSRKTIEANLLVAELHTLQTSDNR